MAKRKLKRKVSKKARKQAKAKKVIRPIMVTSEMVRGGLDAFRKAAEKQIEDRRKNGEGIWLGDVRLATFQAFKYSKADGRSPVKKNVKPILRCVPGAILNVERPNTDPDIECGAGVNVATKEWCLSHMTITKNSSGIFRNLYGKRIKEKHLWLVTFTYGDIACIPKMSDGKIRLSSCEVIKRVLLTKTERKQYGVI